MMRKQKNDVNLILFLLIAFLLPLVSVAAQTMIPSASIRLILFGIQAAAPTISAVLLLCFRKELKTRLAPMFHWNRLHMAVILPTIIAFVTIGFSKLIYCVLSGSHFIAGSLSVTQTVIILWALVAEEIGWRGYLEPLLREDGVPRRFIPCITGCIWCLWHYHFFFQNGTQIPVGLFFIGCIIESYIYSFLIHITNYNIISAMTYHFMWNLWTHIFAINPADNYGSILPHIILIIAEALLLPALHRKSAKSV